MPARLQAAARALTGMGVRLMLSTGVASADGEGVWLTSGDQLVGRILAWMGGIMAPPILAPSGLPTARSGQVAVDRYLRATGHPDVYVVGNADLIMHDAPARWRRPRRRRSSRVRPRPAWDRSSVGCEAPADILWAPTALSPW
jgi:NADH dehydrogenase FAD-containing subunit